MKQVDIEKILSQEKERLERLHQIVQHTIEEEKLIINNLLNPPLEELTEGQKLSDRIARFGGSWKFIIAFVLLLLGWIFFNAVAMGVYKFDPYPFILLNLILSCIAALQAPVIMMSQNRQEEKDRQRNENDYLINLKSEIQIRSLHQKIDLLQEEQIKSLFDTQAIQMARLREIEKSLNEILKKLDQSSKNS